GRASWSSLRALAASPLRRASTLRSTAAPPCGTIRSPISSRTCCGRRRADTSVPCPDAKAQCERRQALKLARRVHQQRDRGDPNGNRPRRAVSSDTADKQCHDGRKRYMLGGVTPEGGIDGKRRSANARACRDSLQGRRGQHNLSEEAAVAGDQLRPACICGYFRNLSALLQSN